MVQDITPNNSSAVTNTNTMSPRTISAQSAGSTTPTIISQSNADRRRKAAAEKAARSRQNLAANVQRDEIEKEYKRLRDLEKRLNDRAEERKKSVANEQVWYYSGGYNSPLRRVYTTLGEYMTTKMKGAEKTLDTPIEYTNYLSMDNSENSGDYNTGYEGLSKLSEHIDSLLKKESEEIRKIEGARNSINALNASSVYTPIDTQMSEDARAAHLRLIEDPTTNAESRQRLIEDIRRDDANKGYVTEGDQTKLMNIALSSTAPKDAKQFAFNYLGDIGSTVGKADFNKSADAIYVSQYDKTSRAMADRMSRSIYDIQKDTTSPYDNKTRKTELKAQDSSSDMDAKTRAAVLANIEGGTKALGTLRKAKENAVEAGDVGVPGYLVQDEDTGKLRLVPDKTANTVYYDTDPLASAQERNAEAVFARQNAEIQDRLNNNPNYVESILKVSDGNKLDLSSDAFFREQAATEREYGNTDWTSAGGKTANRAMMEGEGSTSYSRFKAAPETATNEYILISNDGKQRYTLRTSDRGGRFAIYGWAGDIVASGDTAEGLPSALKKLNVPFNEETFNPYVPDADDSRVMLEEETDLGDMEETPAMFKSKQLGTYRTNDEIRNAEFDRRDAVNSYISNGINEYFDGIQEMKDGLDEAITKNDEEYRQTLDQLSAPPDERAMARQQRFEGFPDEGRERFLSSVNSMRSAAGMGEDFAEEMPETGGFGGAESGNLFSRNAATFDDGGTMPGAAKGRFAEEDSIGGYAGEDLGDEGFDDGEYDDEEFTGADDEGEDFAEEIPEGEDFGRKPVESFGGNKDIFGGAFGKTPKSFGANAKPKSDEGLDEIYTEPSDDFESSPAPSERTGFTDKGSPFMSAAQTSRDMYSLKDKDLSAVPKYTERDHIRKERTKTVLDQMDLDQQIGDIYKRMGLISEGGTDDSGRAVPGLYPSTKKYAETVDELVKSGALISEGNKRESLYSDAENPDKNIDTYTNLRWSSRATPDIMDRFKQVEENMNKASEDLNAEYQKLSEKYKEKEQLEKEVYGGVPYAAKEAAANYLPNPEIVRPALNIYDYTNQATRQLRLTNDKIGNTWDEIWGEPPKNMFTPEYWKEKIYDSPPLLYSQVDYDELYRDPVGYGAQYAASYALMSGLGAAFRAGGKAAPKVFHTVVDPLNNSELKKKSQKYIEELTEKLPRSPVSVQYSIVNLPGGTAKSLSLVRHVKNLDIAHPLVTTLDDRLQNTKELYFGDPKFKNPWVLLQDSNTGNSAEAFIPKSGVETAYVKGATKALLKRVDDSDYYIKTYGFKDKEAYKKSLQNALDRFSIITDLNKHIQNASPVAIQSLEPHVQKVIAAKNIFKYPKKISKAIVETMNDFKVHSQSSLTQFSQGWEFGGGGLSRNPNDFDLFVDNPKEFVEALAKKINDIEGREIVYVKGNKILFKDTGDEFFDAHFMGQFGSDSLFSGMGVRTELPVKIGKSNVTTTTMSQQNINKETALFNFTEPKSYPKFPEAFGEGKPGVGWVQPRKEDRAKDLKDFAFGTLDQINQMLSSKIARERKEGLKALKAFNKFLKTYGDEAYDEIMKDYAQFKKLHGGKTKPFKGEVIRVDKFGINSSPEQGEKAINAAKQKFKKDPQVVDILEKIRENLNTNTVIGVPLGLFMTATYIQSVATRIANRETTPQEVMSKEIMPMFVGAKLSGKSLNKFYEWNAFRKRDRYIPPTLIARPEVVTGEVRYPLRYYNPADPLNMKEYVDAYKKGGEAQLRMLAQGLESPNAVTHAIRVQSKPPAEIRKGVSKVRGNVYNEDDAFSGSAAASGSTRFARTYLDKDKYTKKDFSWNVIPDYYEPAEIMNIMSTKELGEVPLGMGEKKTAEYLHKTLNPDQYAAISAKTAKNAPIIAEDEITARPNLEFEILDDTAYTILDGKKVAVNTVGTIPHGKMHTDVKLSVTNKGYTPLKHEIAKDDKVYDIFVKFQQIKNDLTNNGGLNAFDVINSGDPSVLKQRIRNKLNQINSKSFQKNFPNDKKEDLNYVINELNKMYKYLEKSEKDFFEITSQFTPTFTKIQSRSKSGNPLMASPLYPAKKEDKTKETYKNPFDLDYKMPDFFSPSSPSSVKSSKKYTTTTSRPPTKKSPPSVPSRPSVPSKPSVPSIITSLTSTPPTKKSPPSVPSRPSVPSKPSVPSIPSRPSVPSTPSIPSVPSTPTRPPTTRTPPSKPPVIVPPTTKTPPTKKKTPKIPWDNPQDKKRRTDYNIFNLENTEIPIVRGFEALTGIDTPTYELPANKQTFYQVGNTLTKTLPKSLKEKKHATKQTKKRNKKNPMDDDIFNIKNMGFDGFDVLTGNKTKTVKQSANKPTISLFGNTQTKKKHATKQKANTKKTTWINPFEIPKDFKF